MKHLGFLALIIMLFTFIPVSAKKTVTIQLTGTITEDIEMTVGNSGRKEIISSLPYSFEVSKEELPLKLSFRSDNQKYPSITIPVKPTDSSIGHIYILKADEMAYGGGGWAQQPNTQRNEEKKSTIVGIDTSHGINAAPVTGNKVDNTFALIIANENYEMASHVEMATNDGLAVKSYFNKTLGLSDKQIIYCPDATFGKMNKGIRDIKNIAAAYDGKINLIVYYAGHGIPDNATKDAYLMPVDADGTDPSVCFSLKKLYAEIDAMHLNQTVVFLDACFSGAAPDGSMIVAARGVAIKPKEEKPKGSTIVFTAVSDEETAFPYKDEKHGLFTYYLLKSMQDKKGKMNLGDMAQYIQENVSQKSVVINGKKQTPTVSYPANLVDSWKDLRLTGK